MNDQGSWIYYRNIPGAVLRYLFVTVSFSSLPQRCCAMNDSSELYVDVVLTDADSLESACGCEE